MATSTYGTTVDRRETASLIGSDKVEGTPVYRSNGERVGKIERDHDRQAQRQGRLCGR